MLFAYVFLEAGVLPYKNSIAEVAEFCKLCINPKIIPKKPYFLLHLPTKSKQGPICYFTKFSSLG